MPGKVTRFLAVLLAATMIVSVPLSAAAAEPVEEVEQIETEDYLYSITQSPVEDGNGVWIRLEITEKEGVTLNKVTLPDGKTVCAETAGGVPGFHEADGRNVIQYIAAGNETQELTISYTIDNYGTKEETLSYDVTEIPENAQETAPSLSERMEEAEASMPEEIQEGDPENNAEEANSQEANSQEANGQEAVNIAEYEAAAAQRASGYNGGYTINTKYDFLFGYQFDSIWLGAMKSGVGLDWQVTKNNGDSLTMVTNSIIGTQKAYPDTDAKGWNDSTLRSWLNNYQGDFDGLGTAVNPYNDSFIDGFNPCVLNAFLETEVVNDEEQSLVPISRDKVTVAGINTRDKFYIPDYYDTLGYTGFDPSKNNLNTSWSTRSLVAITPTMSWGIYAIHTGEMSFTPPDTPIGVRPMGNLDLNAVAFLQDAFLYDPEGLQKIAETSNTSWRAVLFDPGQKFTVDTSSITKNGRKKFRIPFSYEYDRNAENAAGINAASAAAMITEGDYKDGRVKYYGIVGQLKDGYAEVTLPEDFNGKTDKLYLMSKGAQPNDYVSQMVEIPIPGTEVVFHANGGEGTMENQILPYGESGLLNANKFTRPGYRMTGWNTAEDGSGTSYRDPEIMNEDNMTASPLHLYAQWEAKEYRVSFDTKGGLGEFPDKAVRFDDHTLIPATEPIKTGYAFEGWLTSDGREVKPEDSYNVLVQGDDTVTELVLTAVYKSNEYKIRFERNGNHVSGSMDPQSMTYDVSAALTENAYMRPGYTFAGWTRNPSEGVEFADQETVLNLESGADKTVTLYAVWNKEGNTPYKVEHYRQKADGSWPDTPDEVESKQGETDSIAAAVPLMLSGYVFDASIEGTSLKGEIEGSGSLILKLYYRKICSVSFDSQGGDYTPEVQITIYGQQAYEPPVTPKKEGYLFQGWFNSEEKWDFQMPVEKEIRLTAGWEPVQYEIAFHKNAEGAAGQMENIKTTYGAEVSITPNTYTYENHTFAGWAATPDGPVIYADGQKVENLTSEQGGTVILYAVWNEMGESSYTIEHYKQNPDGSWPDQASERETGSGRADTTINAVPQVYDGFVFDAAAEGSLTSGVISADGSLVLRLYYKMLHVVEFQSDGGNYTPQNQSVIHGNRAERPENPTKGGYAFDGWYYTSAEEKEIKWNFEDPVVSGLLLTAHWNKEDQPETPPDPETPPSDPSKPSDPSNPINPSKPSKPGDNSGVHKPSSPSDTKGNQSGNGDKSGIRNDVTKSIQTGDASNIGLLFILFACSAAAILFIYKKK